MIKKIVITWHIQYQVQLYLADQPYAIKVGLRHQSRFFCSKSVFRYGGITFQISRGLAALEPPKMEGKGGAKGVGGGSCFIVFNRKRKRIWKKYFVHFVGNLSRIPKLFIFFSFKHKN